MLVYWPSLWTQKCSSSTWESCVVQFGCQRRNNIQKYKSIFKFKQKQVEIRLIEIKKLFSMWCNWNLNNCNVVCFNVHNLTFHENFQIGQWYNFKIIFWIAQTKQGGWLEISIWNLWSKLALDQNFIIDLSLDILIRHNCKRFHIENLAAIRLFKNVINLFVFLEKRSCPESNLLLTIILYNTWTLWIFTINQTNDNGKYIQ